MISVLDFYDFGLDFYDFGLLHFCRLSLCLTLPPMFLSELYALSRYMSSGRLPGNLEPDGLIGDKETENTTESSKTAESELRLAQLQHQLPSNEPGALMHLVEESTADDTEDNTAKKCRNLFKDLKVYLSREVNNQNLVYFATIIFQLITAALVFILFCVLSSSWQVPRESLLFIIPAFGGTVS
jgi:pescadillo protein